MRGPLAICASAVLAGCASAPDAPLDLRSAKVERLSEQRFAVSIEAVNVNGYELARCIAAAYAFAQVDEDGERLYPFYIRDGGKITDEFRRVDGVRQQTARGIQTYSFGTAEEVSIDDHDGRDVMAVDLQIAKCERQGLTTALGGV